MSDYLAGMIAGFFFGLSFCGILVLIFREKPSKRIRNNIIEKGYRPIGRLDTTKPPKGGSVIKS